MMMQLFHVGMIPDIQRGNSRCVDLFSLVNYIATVDALRLGRKMKHEWIWGGVGGVSV